MIAWEWWGSALPYGEALERQRARRERVIAGEASECLALLEHRPVVTYGRRPAPDNPSDQALLARGVEVFHTERGGLATWHGPGQLVGYLICHAESHGLVVRTVVAALERGLIRWLAARGVEARCRADAPGVWVGPDKIGAIGLHFSRGVSMHGFSLNLDVEPSDFMGIVACGHREAGVASLHGLAPEQRVPPRAAAASVAVSVLEALSEQSCP